MSQLEWIRVGPGYAKTTCNRYQMSITGTKKAARYICIHVTGEKNEPYRNIGGSSDSATAKAICQRHHAERIGFAS